jgi:hypothetical protein
MLKAFGLKRLKPEYEKMLSNFAFNFNLRRYTLEPADITATFSDSTTRRRRGRGVDVNTLSTDVESTN